MLAFVVYSLCVPLRVAENIALVRERLSAAARRSGRDSKEIQLMAVSKTFAPDLIREAYQAGQRLFGENRVQEFSRKCSALNDLAGADWHMIGHLQSNKAVQAAELFTAIDSLDSVRLADKLNDAAARHRKILPVLIEINIAAESEKNGVPPGAPELEKILLSAPRWENLQIQGLMSIPPFHDEPEIGRPHFRQLRLLRDQIAARHLSRVQMDRLSMGMSHDFEVAIEEGSTCVRVGTAIFGARPRR